MGPILTVLLPAMLGVVMLGLGLTLTTADFTRVLTAPKAVVVSLVCQLVVLPLLCFGMIKLAGLSGVRGWHDDPRRVTRRDDGEPVQPSRAR